VTGKKQPAQYAVAGRIIKFRSGIMKREIIKSDRAPAAIGPYSQAIRCECSGLLFCSGQISLKPDTGEFLDRDISEQTKQAMENLKGVLEHAGLGFENVVKVTVYLENIEEFSSMNEVYQTYFASNPPARAVIEARRLPKNAKVEIEAIACY
jgi:2-iminobutanoate/2-iminopropanoate deaminase